MPKKAKRKHPDSRSDDFESFAKKLKRLFDAVDEPEQPCRRRVRRLSSSSQESRDPSPTSENQKDGIQSDSNPHATIQPQISKATNQISLADILEAGPSSSTADQHATATAEVAPAEDNLDDTVLEILGDDPTSTVEYGKEIHKELATRFEYLATSGLTKESRKELCEKYTIPANCMRIGAPKLNAEIKAALNETLIKRDKAIEARQKQLASALSCVAQIATDQLLSKDTNHDVLKKIMDVGRLLADIQYSESVTRRNFATYALKKEMKEHLFSTKIDKYLFGESLPDALKTAKAVSKSGTDLKVEIKKKTRPTTLSTTSKPAAKTLNWKTQAPARRQPEPQRAREPATPRKQPGTSSKQSSKPPRRR